MHKENKIIICAALTGAITSKKDNDNLPITEDEIVYAAIDAVSAGAAVIHIHVRNDNGTPSLSYNAYSRVIKRIRNVCNPVICVSTSNYGVDVADKERYRLFNLDSELFTLSFGSINRINGSVRNSKAFIDQCFEIAAERKKRLEIEIFNTDMLEQFRQYANYKGIQSPYVQLIFGSKGGMDSTMKNVVSILDSLPNDWLVSCVGVGKAQLPINMMSMFHNATALRTGLEDNVYYSYGVKAISNAQLVKRLVEMVSLAGYNIATPSDARSLLAVK